MENKKTLEELSHDTFYSMEKYSQLVIDLVQEIEDLYTYNKSVESFGALSYTISTILEVIDKERKDDVEVLHNLLKILEYEIEDLRAENTLF